MKLSLEIESSLLDEDELKAFLYLQKRPKDEKAPALGEYVGALFEQATDTFRVRRDHLLRIAEENKREAERLRLEEEAAKIAASKTESDLMTKVKIITAETVNSILGDAKNDSSQPGSTS